MRNRIPFSQRRSASQWIARVTFAVIRGTIENHLRSAPSVNSRRTPVRRALRTRSAPLLALMLTETRSAGAFSSKIVDQIHIHEGRYVEHFAAALVDRVYSRFNAADV